MTSDRLQLRGIGKRFSAVIANADVDLSIRPGEIRDLCERATILRGGRVVAACDPRATGTARWRR